MSFGGKSLFLWDPQVPALAARSVAGVHVHCTATCGSLNKADHL